MISCARRPVFHPSPSVCCRKRRLLRCIPKPPTPGPPTGRKSSRCTSWPSSTTTTPRRQPARTLPAHARSHLPPHHSFVAAGAQRPICVAGSRSRHAAAPDRPATRQATGRPRPPLVYWPDHNGVGRSATRRQLLVSKDSRHRSSIVSTSLMVDTITVSSRRCLLCAGN